jgi:hypothetical protein
MRRQGLSFGLLASRDHQALDHGHAGAHDLRCAQVLAGELKQ